VTGEPILLLASKSPRRRELLALSGWKFKLATSQIDESLRPTEAASAYVLRLAEAKARVCAEHADHSQIVIGADTTVVEGGNILGKPANYDEAVDMLKRLRGHSHQVCTGIAVLRKSDGRLVTDLCVTRVPMRNYHDKEIEAYVQSGDPFDKAGGYAIQHGGFQPVDGLNGCYASVMGLPLCHLVRTLRRLKLSPVTDVSVDCQTALHYSCPVSAAILRGEQVG
jgi:septum formation protein